MTKPMCLLLVLLAGHALGECVARAGTLTGHVRDQNWFAQYQGGPYGVGYYEFAVNANGLGLASLGGFDDTDIFGVFSMAGLSAGAYTVASWDVWWRSAYAFNVVVPASGSTADVDLRLQATMWGYPAFWEDTGYHEMGQTFVATGPVTMIYLRSASSTSYNLTVHAGGTGGAQVGRSRGFSGAGDHRLIYGYDDMPTVAGQTYYVRIRTSSPTTGGVLRQMDPRPDNSDPMPGGCLWVGDGTTMIPDPDRDLGLIIMADDDGLRTNLQARQSGGSFANVSSIGQTFTARGVSLISAALWLADPSDPTYVVRVRQNGPGGMQIGTSKRGRPARRGADPEMLVTWAPGECPLTSGQTYYLETTKDGGGTFNAVYVNTANPFPFGQAYRDEAAVAGTDLAGTIMEEQSAGSATQPAVHFVSYPIVNEADRQTKFLTVRWTTDVASESWVRYAVDHPPYTVTNGSSLLAFVHAVTLTNIEPHVLCHYQAVSTRAGYRAATSRDLQVTTLPESANLLMNAGFEAGSGDSPRSTVPGWSTAGGLNLRGSDGTWFGGLPPRSGDWFMQGAVNGAEADGAIYQRVTGVTPGVRYTFSAWATTWMRENGTYKYDVWNDPNRLSYVRLGLDPQGGTDPNAATVRWTPRVYNHLRYGQFAKSAIAEGSAMTVFVRVQGRGGEWHLFGVDDAVLTAETVANDGVMSIERVADRVVIQWEGHGWTLRMAQFPTGPWVTLQGATSGFSVRPTFAARFFKLER